MNRRPFQWAESWPAIAILWLVATGLLYSRAFS